MLYREYADCDSNVRAGVDRARGYGWFPLMAVVIAALMTASAPSAAGGAQHETAGAPYVLRNDRTPIGLVYTPEVLSALLSQQGSGPQDRQIVDAVRQQTPIVVMWRVPLPSEVDSPEPPYRVVIVEAAGDPVNPNRIEPVWIRHDAAWLARLDTRVGAGQVGAIAAFPRAAFIRGRVIWMYSDYPVDETGGQRSVRRSALIDWDVTEPLGGASPRR